MTAELFLCNYLGCSRAELQSTIAQRPIDVIKATEAYAEQEKEPLRIAFAESQNDIDELEFELKAYRMITPKQLVDDNRKLEQEIKELMECLDWLYNQDDGNNPEMEKRIKQALKK